LNVGLDRSKQQLTFCKQAMSSSMKIVANM